MLKKLDIKGFTLLEILIAVMIMAICLVVVMQLFSGALNAAGKSEEYTKAVFIGKEKMEEFLLSETLLEGEFYGDYDEKFSWIVSVSAMPGKMELTSGLKRRFQIDLEVLWGAGSKQKAFSLSTITIAGETSLESGEGKK